MRYLTLTLLLFISLSLTAQKIPNKQEASVWAPANIKVDGELKEWGNQNLSAYNSANRIYYVISNDDENLYLTVRGVGVAVGNKILQEGVTFSVSQASAFPNKKSNTAVTYVRFPTSQNAVAISPLVYRISTITKLVADTIKNKKTIDSLTIAANKTVESVAKEIEVFGIAEIPDSILSVYNETGIKAALHFAKGNPVVEFAIPLKYLHLAVNAGKFSYQIKSPPVNSIL